LVEIFRFGGSFLLDSDGNEGGVVLEALLKGGVQGKGAAGGYRSSGLSASDREKTAKDRPRLELRGQQG
jgi:hypothetical protein